MVFYKHKYRPATSAWEWCAAGAEGFWTRILNKRNVYFNSHASQSAAFKPQSQPVEMLK
jgi:hypothetical protein